MYCLGLRIGEVLGLTIEDLKKHPDDNDSYEIYIRNRLSDKPHQIAKTCCKAKNKYDYSTPKYNDFFSGYQKVIAVPRIKALLDNYLNVSRNIIINSDKKIDNIANYAIADCVESTTVNNSYIFLNKNGTPLNSSGWNKELKRIFKMVGLKVDKNNKRDNLNHRFRYGYAMFLLNKKYTLAEIRTYMRHGSLSSTLIYIRHTQEDVLENTRKIDNLRFSKKTKS